MKDFFRKIFGSLNINGREIPAFLLSLLLPFSIWLLHNLSLRYNDYIKVSVAALYHAEGHAAVSSNECEVMVRGRTTGYNMIKFKYGLRGKRVEVPFARMHMKEPEIFYVTSSELQEYTPLIFGGDVNLEYYLNDTLFFRFPFETFRKVPVRLACDFDFAPQYTLAGAISVEPDSVAVYGEPYRLEKIDCIYTEPLKFSGLSSDVNGVARLDRMRGLRFDEESVRYSIGVVRYAEFTENANISVRNVPPGRTMAVFPSSVRVSYRCVFPAREDVSGALKFYVDYNDFISSRHGKCVVRAEYPAQGVISCSVDPQVVECVMLDR